MVIGGRIRRGTVGWWWIALTAAAIAVFAPLPYLTDSLRGLAAGGNRLAANYAWRPPWVQVAFLLHAGAGGLALLLSPLQFATRLRARAPRVHRICGRAAMGAMALAGGTALVLAPLSLAGAAGTVGFGALALTWIGFTVAAYRAIGRGDVAAHRRWAVRAFALTYAAVTLRLWLVLLVPLQIAIAGADEETAFARAYLLVPFLSWIPNLLVADRTLRSGRRARRGVRTRTRP